MHTEQENRKAKIKLGGSLENAHCAQNASDLICTAALGNGRDLIWVSGPQLPGHQQLVGRGVRPRFQMRRPIFN